MEDKKDEHRQQGELHMWDPIDQVRLLAPAQSPDRAPAGSAEAIPGRRSARSKRMAHC